MYKIFFAFLCRFRHQKKLFLNFGKIYQFPIRFYDIDYSTLTEEFFSSQQKSISFLVSLSINPLPVSSSSSSSIRRILISSFETVDEFLSKFPSILSSMFCSMVMMDALVNCHVTDHCRKKYPSSFSQINFII